MILPDINTLVYAFHRDTSEHEPFADWLDSAIADAEPLLLPDTAYPPAPQSTRTATRDVVANL